MGLRHSLFEWDLEKNHLNKRRHGISLEESGALWDGTHVVIPAKNIEGESRFMIVGSIKNRIYAAIFTFRDDKIRIISCHRADRRWERIYYEHTKEKKSDH